MKRWGNWVALAVVAAILMDWLWPFGFRFKRWLHLDAAAAATTVTDELATRFPAGSSVAAASDFLEAAGATCRDKGSHMACRYSHMNWADLFKRHSGEGMVMVWGVEIHHDFDGHVVRFAVSRTTERP